MKSIIDVHDYDEHFLQQFISNILPVYEIWSIRYLQPKSKDLVAGRDKDAELFQNFIEDHSSKDYPHPLIIVLGNTEKNNKNHMSNFNKKYFKIQFENFKSNDIGTPLMLSNWGFK